MVRMGADRGRICRSSFERNRNLCVTPTSGDPNALEGTVRADGVDILDPRMSFFILGGNNDDESFTVLG